METVLLRIRIFPLALTFLALFYDHVTFFVFQFFVFFFFLFRSMHYIIYIIHEIHFIFVLFFFLRFPQVRWKNDFLIWFFYRGFFTYSFNNNNIIFWFNLKFNSFLCIFIFEKFHLENKSNSPNSNVITTHTLHFSFKVEPRSYHVCLFAIVSRRNSEQKLCYFNLQFGGRFLVEN